MERFIGILIENCAGFLPPWLSPIQAVIIPVAPTFNTYALKVKKELEKKGFKVEADDSTERMNAKIRKHQSLKVPYLLIVGEKEEGEQTVSIRIRGGEQKVMPFQEFIKYLEEKITSFSQDA